MLPHRSVALGHCANLKRSILIGMESVRKMSHPVSVKDICTLVYPFYRGEFSLCRLYSHNNRYVEHTTPVNFSFIARSKSMFQRRTSDVFPFARDSSSLPRLMNVMSRAAVSKKSEPPTSLPELVYCCRRCTMEMML